MPQFDFFSFSTQVFWTLLGFFSFYFFILKFYLVKIAQTLKLRRVLKIRTLEKKNVYDCMLFLILRKD